MSQAKCHFAICVRNDGYEDLELRKVYQLVADAAAEEEGCVRLIDESGEDYIYPAEFFVTVDLSDAARAVFRRTS